MRPDSIVVVAPEGELAPGVVQGVEDLFIQQLIAQAGGAIYVAGVLFFLRTALPFQRAIWHALVLAATVCVYAAVLIELTA